MGREFHGTVDHLDEMKTPAPTIKGMHHMAYRVRDAEETTKFYADILGLKPAAALAFDKDPSGADRPYMHLFFEMGDGNYIASLMRLQVRRRTNSTSKTGSKIITSPSKLTPWKNSRNLWTD